MPIRLTHLIFWPLLLALTLGGWFYWRHEVRPYESTDNAYLKSHIIPLSPKIGGYLAEVAVKDNQPVRKGDVLAVIDGREPRAKIVQAEAQRLADQAHLRTLNAMLASQRTNIRPNRASAAAFKADFIGTQSDSTAMPAIGQGFNNLDEVIAARIAETEADLKNHEAALDLARMELENTIIAAPADGVIGKLSVQNGQLARPGSVLAFLIPKGVLWVEANFKEVQLEKMKPGQPVSIQVDALPTQDYHGVVDSFAPASGAEFSILPPENASGNFIKIVRRVPVKIHFNPEIDLSPLKPGLSASVKVRVE